MPKRSRFLLRMGSAGELNSSWVVATLRLDFDLGVSQVLLCVDIRMYHSVMNHFDF